MVRLAGLVAALTALRLLYVAADVTELYADEAYYWVWSKYPDWSYTSKGPLVAYLIRVSTGLGGDTAFFIRLPAVLLGGVTLMYVGRAAKALAGDGRAGFAAGLTGACVPILGTLSTVLTIDGPVLCCWSVGAFHAWRGQSGAARPWDGAVTAAALGLGLMAKGVMIFFVPAYLLFRATSGEGRGRLRSAGPWLIVGTGLMFLAPQLAWNARHEWVMFKDFADKGDVGEPFRIGVAHLADLLGSQAIVLSPLILAGVAWSLWESARRARRGDAAGRFVLCFSLPVLVSYTGLALHAHVNSNWMLTGYLAPLAGLGVYGAECWNAGSAGRRRAFRAAAAAGMGMGAAMGVAPYLMPLAYEFADAEHVQRFDPTVRVSGWKAMAERADYWRRELGEGGEEPFLFGSNYTVPAVLRFYGEGHPEAASLETERYGNQFYLIDDLGKLKGRDGILVSTRVRGSYLRELRRAFGTVEELEVYEVRRGEAVLREVFFYHCRDFEGWTYGERRGKRERAGREKEQRAGGG